VVPSAPSGNGAGSRVAPRSSSGAHGVGQEGLGQQQRVLGPTGGIRCARRGGRKCTGPMPSSSNRRGTGPRPRRPARPPPAARRCVGGGHLRHQRARQASSPCVKVVSMPLPE
jgi:hypothetical protein